jgi:precorrin isomerase
MSELENQVNELIVKATGTPKSEDALRFSQAALNVAHTKHALAEPQRSN